MGCGNSSNVVPTTKEDDTSQPAPPKLNRQGTSIPSTNEAILFVIDEKVDEDADCFEDYEIAFSGGHSDSVSSVTSFSDGSNRVVSASWDNSVRVWDTETGKCIKVYLGHTKSVYSVAVILSTKIVSGSEDQTIRIWNVVSGNCEHILTGHRGIVYSIRVLSDTRIFSGGADGTIRVWDSNNGKCLQIMSGHIGSVNSVRALPDGRIMSGSFDKSIRIWNPDNGECESVLRGHVGYISSVTVLQDGRVVSGSGDKTVRVWNINTGNCDCVLSGHNNGVLSVSVLPDGRIVSGSFDKTIRVWDIKNMVQSENDFLNIHCEVHSFLSNKLLTTINSASLNRIFLEDVSFPNEVCATYIKELQNGHLFIFLNNGDVMIYKPPDLSKKLIEEKKHTHINKSNDNSVRTQPSAKNSGKNDSFEDYEIAFSGGHSDSVSSVASFSDGSARVVSASWDNSVRVWDTETGKCIKVYLGHTKSVYSVAVILNNRIVSGSEDQTIRIWGLNSTVNGGCERILLGHRGIVYSIRVLPDTRIFSGGADGTIRVWDSNNGKCLQVLSGHEGSVNSVRALPDGRIISGSFDKTIRIWNPNNGDCDRVLSGHSGYVSSVTILQDGRIVSGSGDKTVRVWDADTGKCDCLLTGHAHGLLSVSVLPDGRIVSGSFDKTIRIWDVNFNDNNSKDNDKEVPCEVHTFISKKLVKAISEASLNRIFLEDIIFPEGVCATYIRELSSGQLFLFLNNGNVLLYKPSSNL